MTVRARILIAEDHQIMREGLCSLIGEVPGLRVVGEASSGHQAVRLSRELRPDVVVMDVSMPDLNGIEATQQILAHKPSTKVLALSMHTDQRFVDRMLGAGAVGYLSKDSAFEEVTDAIRSVLSDQIYLSTGIARAVARSYAEHISPHEAVADHPLTPRETQVLQLLVEGQSTADIADQLGISVKTVETYRKHIMDKLDLHNVAELTKYALREGLTSL